MRILFIASNPDCEPNLDLDREVTELAREYLTSPDDPTLFTFLPKLSVEHLQKELLKVKPDILHISAHGRKEHLMLANDDGSPVKITPQMLSAFLPPDKPPRLIFLSACDSHKVAKELVDRNDVAMAIGTTNSVSNRAAVASAVAFYGSLLSGLTVNQSFSACKSLIEALTNSRSTAELFGGIKANDGGNLLHEVPHLIADFEEEARSARDDHFSFRLGMAGCPPSTIQVIFFTDDESFAVDDDSLEENLCLAVRTMPVGGILWAPEDSVWRAEGDHRLFGVGVKAGGGCFSVAGTLCGAIENRYRLSRKRLPKQVASAIATLKSKNGADLDPVIFDSRFVTKGKGR